MAGQDTQPDAWNSSVDYAQLALDANLTPGQVGLIPANLRWKSCRPALPFRRLRPHTTARFLGTATPFNHATP